MKPSTLVSTSLLAAILGGCSATVVEGPPPAAAPVVDEIGSARRAAEVAFHNLRKRNFPLDACDPNVVQIIGSEREAWTLANGGNSCTTLAVHRPSGQWVIVVRSGMVQTNPQARVVVAPTLAGVQKVDYAR